MSTELILRPEPWAVDDNPVLDYIIMQHDIKMYKEREMAIDLYFERRMEAFGLPRVSRDDLVSECCLAPVYDSIYAKDELPGYSPMILFCCCDCSNFTEPLSPYQSPKLKKGQGILTIEYDTFGSFIRTDTDFIKVEYITKPTEYTENPGRSFSRRYFKLLMSLPHGVKALRAAVKYGLGL